MTRHSVTNELATESTFRWVSADTVVPASLSVLADRLIAPIINNGKRLTYLMGLSYSSVPFAICHAAVGACSCDSLEATMRDV